MKKIKEIHVRGRRWFDRINGNTYCAAKVFVDGEHVLTTNWQYGYGEYYLQLADAELCKLGITKPDGPMLWRHCEERGIKFSYDVVDGLKRDLVAFSKDKPEERNDETI
jgi:hypothetical protein